MGIEKITNWDGGEIAFERHGKQGEPIVLVHGWSCHKEFWSTLIDAFPEKQFITIDLAGHGDSSGGAREWCFDEFSQDVTHVITHLALNDAVLAGHSMGGMVALHAAAQLKGRIKHVMQVDTFVFDYGFLPQDLQDQVNAGFKTDFTSAVTNLVADTSLGMAKDKQDWVVAQMLKVNATHAANVFADYMTYQAESAMMALEGSVSWLSGGLVSADSRARYAKYLSAEVVLPQLGHFLGQQSPEEVNKAFAYLVDNM